jgi:hypothetical protein
VLQGKGDLAQGAITPANCHHCPDCARNEGVPRLAQACDNDDIDKGVGILGSVARQQAHCESAGLLRTSAGRFHHSPTPTTDQCRATGCQFAAHGLRRVGLGGGAVSPSDHGHQNVSHWLSSG